INKHRTKGFHSYNKGEKKLDEAVQYSGFISLVTVTGDKRLLTARYWRRLQNIYIFENVLNVGLSGISYVCINQSTLMLKVSDVLLLLLASLMSRSPHRQLNSINPFVYWCLSKRSCRTI
uniref:Uncharacterized protein n=1 Tax=Glossina palpalis gambiensis TaxID=67801 RepID=A0A1B0AQZ7_9MUSC